MKATITFSICFRVKLKVAIFIIDFTRFKKTLITFCKVIIINELVACVIWRVNVNHLDCSEIVLTENL